MGTIAKTLNPEDIVGIDAKGRRITRHKKDVTKRNWDLFQFKGIKGRLCRLFLEYNVDAMDIQKCLNRLELAIENSVELKTKGKKTIPFRRPKNYFD